MERDQRKRSRAADGGSIGERKKERETKGKDHADTVPVVVAPPTEDEVDEFFAILRRMREAVKYFEKDKGVVVGKLTDPSREGNDRKVCVKKRADVDEVVLLDLNTVPDERE